MGDDPAHREGYGPIPPQGRPQADGEETLVREGCSVDIPPPVEDVIADTRLQEVDYTSPTDRT